MKNDIFKKKLDKNHNLSYFAVNLQKIYFFLFTIKVNHEYVIGFFIFLLNNRIKFVFIPVFSSFNLSL